MNKKDPQKSSTLERAAKHSLKRLNMSNGTNLTLNSDVDHDGTNLTLNSDVDHDG